MLWVYLCSRMFVLVSFNVFFAIWGGRGFGRRIRLIHCKTSKQVQLRKKNSQVVSAKKINLSITVRSYELLKVIYCKLFSVDAVHSLHIVVRHIPHPNLVPKCLGNQTCARCTLAQVWKRHRIFCSFLVVLY